MAERNIAAEINAASAAGNEALVNKLIVERYQKISSDPALLSQYGNDMYSQIYQGLVKTGQASPVSTPTVATTPTTQSSYTPVSTPSTPVSTPSTPTSTPTTSTPTAAPKTPTAGYTPTGNTQADQIMARMVENANKWHTASVNERKQLEVNNQYLATQLNNLGYNATRDANGAWNVLQYSGGTSGTSSAQVPTTTATGGQPLSAGAPQTGNAQADAILQQMANNANAWREAKTQAEKDQLANASLQLGKQLESLGFSAQRDANGVWNVLNYSNQQGQQVQQGLQGQQVQVPLTNKTIDFALDPITPPDKYMAMNPQDVYNSIMNSATNVGKVFETVEQLAKQALTMGDVDIVAAVKVYTDQIETALNTMQEKYDEMYAQGPNDPGLQAALQLMREGADEQRKIMLEELNARGLSRSGLLVKAEERFIKGAASAEAQLVGQFMSQLYQTYMGSLTNIMNQRVGYLTQMGQLVGEAEIQSAKNRVEAVTAAMNAITDIGNTMAAMHTSAWDTAFNAYGDAMNYNETARHNYTTEQEQRRAALVAEGFMAQELYGEQNQNFLNYQEAVRSNVAGEQQYNFKLNQDFEIAMAQLGIQDAELKERIRANKASEALTWAQVQTQRQKYASDATAEANRLTLEARKLGIEEQKLALDQRMADFNISDRGVQNSLTRMELDIKKAQQETQTWQTDVAKAELMATHLMSTQSTLSSIVEQAKSGKISVTDAYDTLSTMWPTLGVNPTLHNTTAEMQYYNDALKTVENMLKVQNLPASTKAAANRKAIDLILGNLPTAAVGTYTAGSILFGNAGGTPYNYNLDSWTPGINIQY